MLKLLFIFLFQLVFVYSTHAACEPSTLPTVVTCPVRGFPKTVAFKAMDNSNEKAIDSSSNKTDALGSVPYTEFDQGQSGAGYEYIVDGNGDDLLNVEKSQWRDCVESIYHIAWGTIGRKETWAQEAHPSFWSFRVGSYLSENLETTTDTTIVVDDVKYFKAGDYAQIRRLNKSKSNFNWSDVEYVLIDSIDEKNSELTVTRQVDSLKLKNSNTPSSGWINNSSYSIYIAPIYYIFTPQQWHINFSYKAKKDTDTGLYPYQFYADYIYQRWQFSESKGGFGKLIDGFEFDGGRFRPIATQEKMADDYYMLDLNNDGDIDNGYVGHGNYNAYAIGASLSLKRMRTKFDANSCGSDVKLIADSNMVEFGVRDFRSLSGIEMENFPESLGTQDKIKSTTDWQKRLQSFSSGRNHYQTFQNEIEGTGKEFLGYVFTKEATHNYECNDFDLGISTSSSNGTYAFEDNHFFRVGLGTSLTFGIPHAYVSAYSHQTGTPDCKNFAYDTSTSLNEPLVDGGLYKNWDEYFGGSSSNTYGKNDWEWLGGFSSTYPDIIQDSSDLGSNEIKNPVWSIDAMSTSGNYASLGDSSSIYSKVSATSSLNNGVIIQEVASPVAIGGSFYPHPTGVRIKTTFDQVDCSDVPCVFTLSFTARSSFLSWQYSKIKSAKLPKVVRVRIVYSNGNSTYQDILVPTDDSWNDFSLTFLGTNSKIVGVNFEVGEDAGKFKVKTSNLSLSEGSTERFVRYYENGAVLLNMDRDSTYDSGAARTTSGKIGSGSDWTYCLDGSESSTNSFCRVDGTIKDDSGKKVNDGSKGSVDSSGHYTCFTVPQLDAIVLRHCSSSE